MPWFSFEKPFDFSPAARGGRVTIAYKQGVYNVTRECAAIAEALGAGKPMKAMRDDGEDAWHR